MAQKTFYLESQNSITPDRFKRHADWLGSELVKVRGGPRLHLEEIARVEGALALMSGTDQIGTFFHDGRNYRIAVHADAARIASVASAIGYVSREEIAPEPKVAIAPLDLSAIAGYVSAEDARPLPLDIPVPGTPSMVIETRGANDRTGDFEHRHDRDGSYVE